jgi:alpha-glucosidase
MDDHRWWQKGIIYQIYPRSFMDADGDGVGDLAGILQRLDYLAWLGVDAVWISPFFRSPMADFGYDVSDYTDVDPLFGTLADVDRLVEKAHELGLKVIVDFVPNHSSDQHPWFQDSRSSRDNPKRDWYIWRDPAPDGGPPNNWVSNFGGSAWQFDDATGQYYYHAFLKEQADLNWRHPEVRRAMYDALRFWLDRGVDGFRVDVIWHLIKDEHFRDNPVNPDYRDGEHPRTQVIQTYSTDQPEVHEVIAEMRAVIDAYDDRLLIGEIYLPPERLVAYYGPDLAGAHLPFNFQLILAPWEARHLALLIDEYEGLLPEGAWPNWVLGNHDQPRVATRVGPAQARVAAMLLLTLRGTPTLYYGDELGMQDVAVPPDRLQDTAEFRAGVPGFGRDGCRTPMQWDASPAAGFSAAEPWLPVADDHPTVNVEAERQDPRSFLTLHRRLIATRRSHPALAVGTYRPVPAAGDLLAYERRDGRDHLFVVLNLGSQPQEIGLPDGWRRAGVVMSTHLDRDGETVSEVALRPDEGLILQHVE